MAYGARVLADSLSPDGVRLTTVEATYPRFVHAELMTHRVFSRNSASSRAIPVEKMIARVLEDPVLPVWWGKNQAGMQAREELDDADRALAIKDWLEARDAAVCRARSLHSRNVHKQIVNRLLEPWMWITVLVSSTEWSNWNALRLHPDAQPELRRIAELIAAARELSTANPLAYGEWHLPLVEASEPAFERDIDQRMVSVGRCARVSYLTHDGRRDPRADEGLAWKLLQSGHMSPFEHVARPAGELDCKGLKGPADEFFGNYRGWIQVRKTLPNEHDFALARANG